MSLPLIIRKQKHDPVTHSQLSDANRFLQSSPREVRLLGFPSFHKRKAYPNGARTYSNYAQIPKSEALKQSSSTEIQIVFGVSPTIQTKYRSNNVLVKLSRMCYYLVFGHLICNNDHPQPGSGEIFQRQCRLQAEESHRTGKWEVRCDRSTPPFFIFEKPNMHMVVTENLDCKTCCELEQDSEMKRLQAVSDKIGDKRDKKREIHAKLMERLVKEVYLRNVNTEAEGLQWHKDCDRWEKWQKSLENEIKLLSEELEEAEKQVFDRRHEIEEPNEDDFIDVALEEYERYGNQDGGRGHLFYYGTATRKEAMEHPYHFPKYFPPEHTLRWHTDKHLIPY